MSPSLDDLTPMAHCFAWLSRTFPRSISDRYGGEMLDAFVRQRRVLGRTEGRWAAFRFSLSACLNVAKEGLQARGHRRIEKRVSGSESASKTKQAGKERFISEFTISGVSAVSSRWPCSALNRVTTSGGPFPPGPKKTTDLSLIV